MTRHLALYLKQEPLTKDGAAVMTRLMQQTQDSDYGVLDVRRQRLWRAPSKRRHGYDLLLRCEADAFGTMWQQLRQVA